ncbi:hypothetical protein FRB91_009446, partial [Serendipita sp. 411]
AGIVHHNIWNHNQQSSRDVNLRGDHHNRCFEFTRQNMISSIEAWIKDKDTRPIYCLQGAPGVGKSTLAKEISHQLQSSYSASGITLAAQIFFSRESTETSSTNGICRHISDFLQIGYPEKLEQEIRDFREKRPALLSDAFHFRDQWDTLVVPFLQKIPSPHLIIIDALDECRPPHRTDLLESLLDSFKPGSRFLPLTKILLTTRDEEDLLTASDSVRYESFCHTEKEKEENDTDVECYIRNRCAEINKRKPPLAPDDIDRLVQRADGLFLFASTACDSLKLTFDRENLLKAIMDPSSTSSLDSLYLAILNSSVPNDGVSLNRFKQLLEIVVAAHRPLSFEELAIVLAKKIDAQSIQFMVTVLSGVMAVSSTSHVHIRHNTFREFLCRRRRAGDYVINQHAGKEALAFFCFQSLKNESPTMADIFQQHGHSAISRQPSPPRDVNTQLDGSRVSLLDYASSYWVAHARDVIYRPDIQTETIALFESNLIRWINLLVQKGGFGSCMTSLDQLWRTCESARRTTLSSQKLGDTIGDWSKDVLAFLQANQLLFQRPGLDIYGSALTFLSRDSCVYRHYNTVWRPRIPLIRDGGIWMLSERHSRILHGHEKAIKAIAVSGMGDLIASGDTCGVVNLWNGGSGALITKTSQDQQKVVALALDPSGRRLFIAYDQSVCIRDCRKSSIITSGAFSVYSESTDEKVTSAAFSAEANQVYCGTNEGRIYRLGLDGNTLIRIECFQPHPLQEVTCIAYHAQPQALATASNKGEICLFRAASYDDQTRFSTPKQGPVFCLAFHPRDSSLLVGSHGQIQSCNFGDCEIPQLELWGQPTRELPRDIAFSSEGAHVAVAWQLSKTAFSRVAVYDWRSQDLLSQYSDHYAQISVVLFSRNDMNLVSASNDTTIRIRSSPKAGWSMVNEAHATICHAKRVMAIAFSPCGRKLASAGADGTLCIWDPSTGTVTTGPVELGERYLRSLIYSPNGQFIVCGDLLNRVIVWNVNSGQIVRPLAHRKGSTPEEICALAYSDDGSTLAASVKSGKRMRMVRGVFSIVVWGVNPKGVGSGVIAETRIDFDPHGKPLRFVRSEQGLYLVCGEGVWSLNASQLSKVSDQQIQEQVLQENMKPLLALGKTREGFQWVDIFSDHLHSELRHSYAISKAFEVWSHAIQGATIALGTTSGVVLFLDCSECLQDLAS